MDLMNSRKRFVERDRKRVAPFLCGVHLRTIVGLERRTIKHLEIDLEFVAREYIDILARFTSSTLSTLLIACSEMERSRECYEALDVFSSNVMGFGAFESSILILVMNLHLSLRLPRMGLVV
jgi:hypothetical protein